MAEGLLRAVYGKRYEVYSAGVEPSNVNPYAVKVMREIDIDLSTHKSKSIDEMYGILFDIVVTVCDQTKETCPFFHSKGREIHKSFDDPSKFEGTDEEILSYFRFIRDQIKDWIDDAFAKA
jgi:arsenate reductase